jgi:hypothetical protein
MSKTVDLSGEQRNSLTIKVGGEMFLIDRVVLAVRQKYEEYSTLVSEGAQLYSVYQELMESISGASEEKQQELQQKIDRTRERMEAYNERVSRDHGTLLDLLLEIIRLIVEKNGYEYDRDWWLENVTQAEIVQFISEVLNKDTSGAKKKEAGEK